MQTTQPCVNCGIDVQSNFCPECGQSTRVRPISWKGLILELSTRWLGTDNLLARTFIGLWLRPAKVISEYLAGNRVKYIPPLSYLVVMSALYILSFSLFGITTEEFLRSSMEQFDFQSGSKSDMQQKFQQEYLKVFSNNMRLMVGAIIPFLALSWLAFYRNRNYLEHFLVASYATAHLLWVSILFLAFQAMGIMSNMTVGLLISVAYFVWAVGSLYKEDNKIWSYVKALLAWAFGYLIFVVFMSILAVIIVVILLTSG